jgi:Flp pilus assembly protein TadD
MTRPRLTRRRLGRWLRGRATLPDLLGLRDLDRDELAWRARRLIDAGAFADASRVFDLLARLWPEDIAEATLGRGVCAQLAGDLAGAERAYTTVLDAEPLNPYALANRAEVRLLAGRKDDARADLARAAEMLGRAPAADDVRRRVEQLRALAEAGV